jgi:hypothetical protein
VVQDHLGVHRVDAAGLARRLAQQCELEQAVQRRAYAFLTDFECAAELGDSPVVVHQHEPIHRFRNGIES